MTPVLILADGAGWEADLLAAARSGGVTVLRRCVDLTDLLAAATLRQAQVAVIPAGLPFLDAEAVRHLRRHDLAVVAVGDDGTDGADGADRLERLGVARVVVPEPGAILAGIAAVLATEPGGTAAERSREPEEPDGPPGHVGRVVAVWGPAGAPGRTTVAIGLATELAAAGRPVVLIDADPYGGTVAARLDVLDEVSGLLAVARLGNLGTLDRHGLVAACRRVEPGLLLLTGLPRAERRIEVRPEVTTEVLRLAAQGADVVVDVGFCIEEGDRDRMTLEALGAADEIVVVGLGDHVGLARLVRALVDLGDIEAVAGVPVRVVLNRFRAPGRIEDVAALVAGYASPVGMHVLPDSQDRSAAPPAMVAVARACFPDAFPAAPRRRRAGRARWR